MKILLDEDTPRPLRGHLPGHSVATTQEMGWAGVKNGRLLQLAEENGFEILLTCDRNLRHQQNLAGRTIAVMVLIAVNKKMETLLPLIPEVLRALPTTPPGTVAEVALPSTPTPAEEDKAQT